jgi:cobalt-precorrin-5B (C1)-methyltransferase
MERLPQLDRLCFVQAADFYQFSLRAAAERGFTRVVWGCFFGKLVKMAQGHAYTHAKDADLDFARLARWCRDAGAAPALTAQVAGANTARQALEILAPDPARPALLRAVAERAMACGRTWAKRGGKTPALAYYCFDFDGTLLVNV